MIGTKYSINDGLSRVLFSLGHIWFTFTFLGLLSYLLALPLSVRITVDNSITSSHLCLVMQSFSVPLFGSLELLKWIL
ncbi:hypothetical protein RRG08_008656 [Elysia crispata]|uniref:Uncharacterized protein n=1 Tax=Elysia crispata TaxID=231223 RepID=A0AAE1DTB8_9GAST|nr:hypothetical protein RRG08_008656 [Elysia crispata]